MDFQLGSVKQKLDIVSGEITITNDSPPMFELGSRFILPRREAYITLKTNKDITIEISGNEYDMINYITELRKNFSKLSKHTLKKKKMNWRKKYIGDN